MEEEKKGGEGNPEKNVEQKDTAMIPKVRLDQEIAKRKTAEQALEEVAASLKETVPEEHRDLIPELPPQKLIKWIQAANAKGLLRERQLNPWTRRDRGTGNQWIFQTSALNR
jgi:hypothetical protein